MTDFQYTDALEDIDSSAVDDAYYNVNDKTLLVVLASSEDAYVYTGVPSYVWSAFKSASSKGSYYATQIKRNYGPAKPLGNVWDLDIDEASTASVTPIAPYVTLGNPPTAATGTPKGLTLSENAKVTTSAEAFPGVSKATTTVTFETDGGVRKEVDFNDKSTVDEALAEFSRLATMLGVDLKVKAVTVNFE